MKLTSNLKKHLMKIAESFAKDQQINGDKQYIAKLNQELDKYKSEMKVKYNTDLSKLKELKAKYDKECEMLKIKLSKDGMRLSSYEDDIYTYGIENEISKKLDKNRNIQWDVILSSVALKLELCATFEDAKLVIQDVTGANIDTMMATIIPPNLQLTNNNN